jgi:hypothetical protein
MMAAQICTRLLADAKAVTRVKTGPMQASTQMGMRAEVYVYVELGFTIEYFRLTKRNPYECRVYLSHFRRIKEQ